MYICITRYIIYYHICTYDHIYILTIINHHYILLPICIHCYIYIIIHYKPLLTIINPNQYIYIYINCCHICTSNHQIAMDHPQLLPLAPRGTAPWSRAPSWAVPRRAWRSSRRPRGRGGRCWSWPPRRSRSSRHLKGIGVEAMNPWGCLTWKVGRSGWNVRFGCVDESLCEVWMEFRWKFGNLCFFLAKLRTLGTWGNVPNKSAEDWIVDGFRSICEDLCWSFCMSFVSIRWYFYGCFLRIYPGHWCRTGTWVRADMR